MMMTTTKIKATVIHTELLLPGSYTTNRFAWNKELVEQAHRLSGVQCRMRGRAIRARHGAVAHAQRSYRPVRACYNLSLMRQYSQSTSNMHSHTHIHRCINIQQRSFVYAKSARQRYTLLITRIQSLCNSEFITFIFEHKWKMWFVTKSVRGSLFLIMIEYKQGQWIHTAEWRAVFIPPLDSGYWFCRHAQGNIKPCRTLRIMCGRQLVQTTPRRPARGWSKRKRPGYTSTYYSCCFYSQEAHKGMNRTTSFSTVRVIAVDVCVCEKQYYIHIFISANICTWIIYLWRKMFLNDNSKTL